MKVKLIDAQENALELLIYTKSTRLQGEQSLAEIKQWSYDKKMEHLDYMTKTIQSSFEFVNYTFEISGVSRAFTHQLVRTRSGSYAQESQRTVDVREAEFINPGGNVRAEAGAEFAKAQYAKMIDCGVPVQEARAVLPTGIATSIICQFDLRTLMSMAEVRLCTRTQGEYQKVFKQIVAAIRCVHPWAADLLRVYCVKYGTCCFPNYTECPVQQAVVEVSNTQKNLIHKVWLEVDHEANPIAKNGKTM